MTSWLRWKIDILIILRIIMLVRLVVLLIIFIKESSIDVNKHLSCREDYRTRTFSINWDNLKTYLSTQLQLLGYLFQNMCWNNSTP